MKKEQYFARFLQRCVSSIKNDPKNREDFIKNLSVVCTLGIPASHFLKEYTNQGEQTKVSTIQYTNKGFSHKYTS